MVDAGHDSHAAGRHRGDEAVCGIAWSILARDCRQPIWGHLESSRAGVRRFRTRTRLTLRRSMTRAGDLPALPRLPADLRLLPQPGPQRLQERQHVLEFLLGEAVAQAFHLRAD